SATTDFQPETIGQYLPRVPQREPHLLVEDRGQSQRLGSQLDRAHSHCIGGLQSMPPLYLAATTTAATHSYIEAAHQGAPYNLFLILRFVALKLDRASAMGNCCGSGTGMVSSTRDGVRRQACFPYSPPGLRPGRLGWS